MKPNLDRRNALKLGATFGLMAVAGTPRSWAAKVCGLTPAQTKGPFYPGEALFRPENDLTTLPGSQARAQGQIAYIFGKVSDERCVPIANANVEIWQACHSGRYSHSQDPNPAPLDPNFRYWGETYTDSQGAYSFKTVVPGAYPAGQGWVRPPHIHFRVSALGYHELVTQMYFKGDSLNESDLILSDLDSQERDRVIVPFDKAGPAFEPGAIRGDFMIALRSVKS